jgi:hypothetical protein
MISKKQQLTLMNETPIAMPRSIPKNAGTMDHNVLQNLHNNFIRSNS